MVDSLVSFALEKLNSILGDEDRAVKIWLEKVKDVAYHLDDILDEWTTEALRSQVPDEGDRSCFSKNNVRTFLLPITCLNHVVLRCKIGSRIKKAQKRLAYIAGETSQLGLRVDSGERERLDSEARRGVIKERETGSLLDGPLIVGREHEKNEVLDLLLQEVTKVPFVISIVGMGGVGKTTLAQLTYNDEKVKGHFDMRMWVCVPEDFDVKRITKSIIKSADTEFKGEKLDLDQLQICLCEMLQGKRFLLVLDDIWSEESEEWDKLRLPFQAGSLGSPIIITTRSEKVTIAMGGLTYTNWQSCPMMIGG
ncbi:putative disease resistance protein RGA3 [Magnolia sinica]|uniref:putative disease resistance protein RGA3 n=1 Tax=Magnolia sinica TaxID=86752 RepID=UPI00265A2C92|nr:putative disease resistance protein RGA3 [Magnolia sinica]